MTADKPCLPPSPSPDSEEATLGCFQTPNYGALAGRNHAAGFSCTSMAIA
jgi:hypothetical protein